jgi:erythromycin esterase-like protein
MLRQLGPLFAEDTDRLVEGVAVTGTSLDHPGDLDPLLEAIGDARYVLLGEASHGTSEYYAWRARLSQRLITEKGFSFIAVEGDWPDCYAVNRYVKGYDGAGEDALSVLRDFDRWPTWMWSNWEIVALSEWLRHHNAAQPAARQVGFYGLDVYSLWESMTEIMHYLSEYQPEALESARRAFLCFEPYGQDVQAYARATALVPTDCEDEVIALLRELRQRVRQFPGDDEADFNAEQNAVVLAGAERYYRTMVRGGGESWNVRDYHMADTLDRLTAYHEERWQGTPKAIVWEHNTHIGDVRHTDMAEAGMVNVGQLARQRHEDDSVWLVGCAGHRGSVIAGSEWDAPMARMPVPPGKQGSWEQVFHDAWGEDRLVLSRDLNDVPGAAAWRGHRAIGVVYHPEYEFGNYVPTVLPQRYDALLYFDDTEALHPLYTAPRDDRPPELYPWGL